MKRPVRPAGGLPVSLVRRARGRIDGCRRAFVDRRWRPRPRSSSAALDAGAAPAGRRSPSKSTSGCTGISSRHRRCSRARACSINDMNEAQRKLAHDLLKAGLSQRGYMTAIVDHGSRDRARRARSGAARGSRPPAATSSSAIRSGTSSRSSARRRRSDTWGWRVEGHHISLHFTVVNGTLVASSPSFFGTNPAEVREGPKKGLRILGGRRRRRARAGDGARRIAAHEGDHRRDRAERHGHDGERGHHPLSPTGISADAMNAARSAIC